MINRTNILYKYDGSFEGLMCCVFESYDKKEIPMDIISPAINQITLFSIKEIETNSQKYFRVLNSIPKKISLSALDFIKYVFLTCLPQKELCILLFLRKGYKSGSSIMTMLGDETVSKLFKAVKHLNNESHLIKGFLRFSVFTYGLAAQIGPQNYILPLIKNHFCDRYPEENFLIYDKTHGMALIYHPHKAVIIDAEDLQFPEIDEEEQHFRKLWQVFYNTIEIEGRHNPKCRNRHMPKRYWEYMTEFKDV